MVEELNFLIYPVSNCIGCGLLVPLFFSIDFDVDIVGVQMFDFEHFVEPNRRICL